VEDESAVSIGGLVRFYDEDTIRQFITDFDHERKVAPFTFHVEAPKVPR
jgi:hypothetical protein